MLGILLMYSQKWFEDWKDYKKLKKITGFLFE